MMHNHDKGADSGNHTWGRSRSNKAEAFIRICRDQMIELSLRQGYSVIVDDTNLAPRNAEYFQQMADRLGAKFEVEDFTERVSLEECIRRNAQRANPVPHSVIMRMYNDFIKPKPLAPPAYDMTLPDCIVVDLDGTTAELNGRDPFDYRDDHEPGTRLGEPGFPGNFQGM